MNLITHISAVAEAEEGERRENTMSNWHFLLTHYFLTGTVVTPASYPKYHSNKAEDTCC